MPAPASRTVPRSLAEDLRGRDDAALARLFAARPDVASPTPADTTQVASRASSRTSVAWAADRLDAGSLRVLAAVAEAGPTTSAAVAATLGADVDADAVERRVRHLHEIGLLWGPLDDVRAVREAADVVASVPDPVPGAAVDAPPPIAPRPVDERRTAVACAGTATETVQRVEALLAAWGSEPPPVLRSGGIGVREVRAAASALGVPSAEVERLVALARGAHLLAVGDDPDGAAWMPTVLFDRWREAGVAERWAVLARGWLDGPGRAVRRLVLRVLVPLRPDGVADVDDVLAAVAWHAPRAGEHRDPMARQALDEAAALGVVVSGALTAPGAALVGGDPVAAMDALLPPPVDHLLLQADLAAVAPGPLEPALARQVEQLADAESTGGAAVYRFTDASLRRALDLGWPAERIHAFLAEHARTPVPQPLSYLVDDAARRHGRLRVGRSASYLRTDDPAELDALVADAAGAGVEVHRLAPTIAVSDLPSDLLLERLRRSGHRAVAEGADGSVEHARPRAFRSRPADAPTRSAVDAAAAVAAVRAGDRAVDARPAGDDTSGGRTASMQVVVALREAAEGRASVWLSYMDQAGAASERVVDPVRVDAGVLTAFDHRSGRLQTFTLHRISRVAPAG